MIENLLKNKTAKQRANLKGKEIAKVDFCGKYTSKEYGVKIDIQSIKTIEGGVEVFAKAWKKGKQLGFGKDGSVEIERFKIYNPPIPVKENGVFIESPAKKIKRELSQIIKLTGKENTEIIKGKVGNTTSTFYPSLDGNVQRESVNETWSTLMAGAGTNSGYTATGLSFYAQSSATTDQYKTNSRLIWLFDTSGLPDGDTIDSAILSNFIYTKYTDIPVSYNIVSSNPASDSALVDADYGTLGSTKFASAFANSSVNTSAYTDFTLNASGIANISKTGLSKFGSRLEEDIDNTEPTWSWLANKTGGGEVRMSETSGTSEDPKLVVVHSAAAGPANLKSWNGLAVASIKSINGVAIASVKSINGLA